jgi:hypothetical protein
MKQNPEVNLMTEEFGKWLLHDDQKERFEIVFALGLNIVFLMLIVLSLWPLDKVQLAIHLATGCVFLWTIILLTFVFLNRIHHVFRINLYERFHAYLASNLFMSCFLQTGWAAFAALTLQNYMAGASVWTIVALYLVGGFSCFVAFYAVSAFYQGHIYRLISLPVALTSFLIFNIWPSSARMLYGWFFNLF